MNYSTVGEIARKQFIDIYHKMAELGPKWTVAVAILIFAWLLSRLLKRVVQRVISRTSTQGHVDILISRVVSGVTIGIGLIIALSVVGVSLSAALATVGLASVGIGFALQDILGNLFAGIILLLQHPFTIGDQVQIGGLEGVVENVRVRDTQILTYDGERIYIPNRTVFSSPIINYTSTETLRVDLPVKIKHFEDVEIAKELARAVVTGYPGVLRQPAPAVLVRSETKEVELVLRFWVESDRNRSQKLRSDLTETVLKELTGHGIETIHEPGETKGKVLEERKAVELAETTQIEQIRETDE